MSFVASLLAVALACAPAPSLAGIVHGALEQRAVESAAAIEAHVGNDCRGEADGPKCHKGGVLVCVGGRASSFTTCKAYEECEQGVCQDEACNHKGDGANCHSNHLVDCSLGKTLTARECGAYEECKVDGFRPNAASCHEICERIGTGAYCEDGSAVSCADGRTANISACTLSQTCKSDTAGGIRHATCEEKDCSGKARGSYCMHGGVVECQDMRGVGFTECAFYQACDDRDGAAQCVEEACDGKADGWHCWGDHRVSCSGGRTADFEICPDLSGCHEHEAAMTPVCQSSAAGLRGVGGSGGSRAASYDISAPGSFAQLAAPSAALLVMTALAGSL